MEFMLESLQVSHELKQFCLEEGASITGSVCLQFSLLKVVHPVIYLLTSHGGTGCFIVFFNKCMNDEGLPVRSGFKSDYI